MVNIIVILVVLGIFSIGATNYWQACTSNQQKMNIRFKRNRYKNFKDIVYKEFAEESSNNLFEDTSLNVSTLTYQFFRYLVLIIWMSFMMYQKLTLETYNNMFLFIWVVIFFCTSPRKTMLGHKSPFKYFVDYLRSDYRYRKNREICRAISQLKNLSIARAKDTVSSDYILEELMKYTKITKPIFSRTLLLWYECRREEACEYFAKSIDTNEGIALSSLFIKLDNLNPIELIEQLELYQNNVREKRKTDSQQKREKKSNWIFAAVMFTATVILLNFIVITIVIDAIGYYSNLKIK